MSHRNGQATSTNSSITAQPQVSAVHWKNSNPISRNSSKSGSRKPSIELKRLDSPRHHHNTNGHTRKPSLSDDDLSDLGSDADDMGDKRSSFNRPRDGKSSEPLLDKGDEDRGRGYDASPPLGATRPPFLSRRSTMKSRSPDTAAKLATRKKYTYAAFFLGLSLVSFVIQTETAVYIQHELGWNKAYCML